MYLEVTLILMSVDSKTGQSRMPRKSSSSPILYCSLANWSWSLCSPVRLWCALRCVSRLTPRVPTLCDVRHPRTILQMSRVRSAATRDSWVCTRLKRISTLHKGSRRVLPLATGQVRRDMQKIAPADSDSSYYSSCCVDKVCTERHLANRYLACVDRVRSNGTCLARVEDIDVNLRSQHCAGLRAGSPRGRGLVQQKNRCCRHAKAL